MRAGRAAAIFVRQLYLLRGSPARVLPLFAWITVDIVLWGFITRYLNTVAAPGYNFVPALLGAVLLWDFFARVMHGVTTAFLEDVWSRNFLNFFASPLKISEYLTGLVLSSIVTSAVGLLVMLLLASFVFGLSFASYGILLVPFLLVLFLFGIALGVVGAAVVLRFGPASEWFVWPLPALVSPFAGVFYPLSTLPLWMRGAAHALPASYVFEGMRAVVAGGEASWAALVWGVLLAALYVLLACWLFVRPQARRTHGTARALQRRERGLKAARGRVLESGRRKALISGGVGQRRAARPASQSRIDPATGRSPSGDGPQTPAGRAFRTRQKAGASA